MLSRLVATGLQRQRAGASSGRGKEAVVRVGVISPYRGQVQRIRQDLRQRRLLVEGGPDHGYVSVEVSEEVDRYVCLAHDCIWFCC